MTFKNKLKRFFDMEDEYEEKEIIVEEEPEEYEPPARIKKTKKQERQNVVSLSSVTSQQGSKVMLLEPHSYDEVQDIADELKNRKAVVINLQRLPRDQARRIVDFLSGTVYAIGGDIQKLGEQIFLCTPDNVDVSGSISEMLHE
ncbi:cell division protein SepF [Alkalicoccus luteus]|uniref:Cell division protein SepF n=1 Tax=Alkalicoccus luteus TaxID=1237094 RepID=A0A969PVI9_9BACI|nr:cell division protein SepF [Alkalicoccus luteus]NJP36437.1 cell division protein SepF [Alkalicoccus luteus]